MNSSPNNQYDPIERIIFETGIRIATLGFEVDEDRLNVVLTSGKVLRFKLSAYQSLQGVEQTKLMNYELIGDGLGAHWPDLDEDLSLKGFLEEQLKLTIGGNTRFEMAA